MHVEGADLISSWYKAISLIAVQYQPDSIRQEHNPGRMAFSRIANKQRIGMASNDILEASLQEKAKNCYHTKGRTGKPGTRIKTIKAGYEVRGGRNEQGSGKCQSIPAF